MTVGSGLFSVKSLLEWRHSNGADARAIDLASGALSVPPLQEGLPDLQWEVYRARRYRRPLSLVVLSVGAKERVPSAPRESAEDDGESILLETRIPHLASLLLGKILQGMLRQSDRVTHLPVEDRFVLALPETDREQAFRSMARLGPVVRERVGVELRAGAAAFPEDGLTLGDLMEEAESRWRRASSSAPGLDSGPPDGTTHRAEGNP